MFDILKKEIKQGDQIKLYLLTGKEIEATILEIGDNYILVKNQDGFESRFFQPLIGGWDIMKLENALAEPLKENNDQVIKCVENNLNEKDNQDTRIEEESKDTIDESSENQFNIKVIGKIDLDKIDPKNKKKKREIKQNSELNFPKSKTKLSQHIAELNKKYTSLDELQHLKDIITSENSKLIIPANVILKKYFHNYEYGYLTDQEGKDYKFYLSDVKDPILKDEISNRIDVVGRHIICSTKIIYGKLYAKQVYYPKKVEDFQLIAETLYKEKEYRDAKTVLYFILDSVNDYEPAVNLINKISRNDSKFVSISASSKYLQAKTELKRGNNDYAKKLLLELVEKTNEKSENALKELSYVLQREGNIEEAIEIVSKYKNLIKTSDPNSLIAYFHEAKKDYNTALVYLKKIKTKNSLESIRLEKRLAIAYFQIKDYLQSEKYLRSILKQQPTDHLINRQLELLERIKLEGLSDEIESIFNEAELSSLSGGKSPYIQFAMENCEYSGIPAAIVSEEKFTRTTLKELRKLIEGAGKARPKERASYLLTESKLMELLEPEKEDELSSVLSRYCLALSQSLASENSSPDIVRFYLLEAFKLARAFDVVSRYLPIYLHSFHLSSFESYKFMSMGMDDTLKEIFKKEINVNFWNGIIDLFLTNTEIFSQLLTRLYQDDIYQKYSLGFLNNYLGFEKNQIKNKELFSDFWNQAIDKRRREKETFNSNYLSLGKNTSSEGFAEAFNSAKTFMPDWIGNLDKYRLNSFDDIIKIIYEFNTQTAFEDKERYFNLIESSISNLKLEIEKSPTEFSFNILQHQLELLNNIITKEFDYVIRTSKPVINIKILGESIINVNRIVTTNINIKNKKGSAPISWYKIEIKNTDDIEFIYENNEIKQTLKGGDDKTLKMQMRVSQKIQAEKAFNININLKYKIRGSEESISFIDNLTVRLYSLDEFDQIPNIFASTADSGPVQDEKMFYGRDEFITNIKNSLLDSVSKCIIIYGQKRSGKSSVLYHLKKQLNDTSNAFCISFSLGEIIDELSSLTFYYKILSEIEDSLEYYPKKNKPVFTAPTLSELKEAPAIIFNDYMKKFTKECSAIDGWGTKNLILLIDEFTYIYTAIRKGFLSDQFMKTWKSFVEKGYFTSILIGQDIMPKFKMAYQNEFGISEDKRLSYLLKEDAIKLIEEPIWDKKRSQSRYLGKAVDLILDYTSSNPYYIQIFCARLVEYMNNNKAISVTEADVYEVAQTFITGEQSLNADKFDNLITAGDADVDTFNPEDILKVLKEIAFASKNLDSCSRDSIKLEDREKEEQIILDLKTREVISCPQQDYYKINVRLFKEWLIKN